MRLPFAGLLEMLRRLRPLATFPSEYQVLDGYTSLGGSAPGYYDVRDFGALSSPNDIGPALQAALDAASAYGGGAAFIPPRQDGVSRFWGSTTPVLRNASPTQGQGFSVLGVPNQTFIAVEPGQGQVLQIADSNALIEIDGLAFFGLGSGVNCPNVVSIAQARIGKLTRCQFWGLDCDETARGVAYVIADSTIVDTLLVHGCNYSGDDRAGGCLNVTGARDTCLIQNVRFEVGGDGTFNGTTYNKSDASTNTHLWLGPQGFDPDADPNGFGEMLVQQCYFNQNARDGIMLRPAAGFIDHARISGCSFNGQSIGTGAPINGQFTKRLAVEHCTFGNSAAGTFAVVYGGPACERLIMRECTGATGGKTIYNAGAYTYLERDECPGITVAGSSPSSPTHSMVKENGVITVLS